ncbi:MAG: hypothetical protein ACKOHG_14885, partial [Planctomycetia bacterium]
MTQERNQLVPEARRGAGGLVGMEDGLTLAPAGSMARPTLPKSTTLSAARIHAVDLEEQMDPLAVAEATADDRRSLATAAGQLLVIALAAAAIWWLLPRG